MFAPLLSRLCPKTYFPEELRKTVTKHPPQASNSLGAIKAASEPHPMHHHDSADTPKVCPSLIERALQRDESACTEMVETLYPSVVGIIRRNLPRTETPEDLAQEVFIKVFTNLSKYRGTRPFDHWVSRITTLTCYDALSAALEDHLDPQNLAPSSLDLVEQLLATLKPRDQLVIRLLHLEEKSVADISAETGWSASKVKVTAMRARQKLKKHLQRLESAKPQLTPHENSHSLPPLGRPAGNGPLGTEGASA